MGITHIQVDCQTTSDLNWKNLQTDGDVWWDLNLGLFRNLRQPISSEVQVRSLGLALEHFTKQLWEPRAEQTRGATLFEGSLDLTKEIKWNEEDFLTWLEEQALERTPQNLRLFCHTIAMDYFDILIGFLPESLNPKIVFDASGVTNLFDYAQLYVNRTHEYLDVEIRNPPVHSSEDAECGIVMPQDFSQQSELIAKTLEELAKENIPFKILNERYLTDQWQGIESMLVDPAAINEQGMRKLRGFCAAGGNVVNLGEPSLGLAYETGYTVWFDNLRGA